VTLTPHLLLVPRSKKQSRAKPLLSLRAFLACKKGVTYLICLQPKGWTNSKVRECDKIERNEMGGAFRTYGGRIFKDISHINLAFV
jgi:hypothetical protein